MHKRIIQRNLAFISFGFVSLLVFWNPLTRLVRFSFQYEHYSHIILIPAISLGLVYWKRESIFANVEYDFQLGVISLLLGIVLFWLARWAALGLSQDTYLSLAISSMVVSWLGGFVACYGSQAFRAGIFPLLFLLFMIPIPALLLDKVVLFFAERLGGRRLSDFPACRDPDFPGRIYLFDSRHYDRSGGGMQRDSLKPCPADPQCFIRLSVSSLGLEESLPASLYCSHRDRKEQPPDRDDFLTCRVRASKLSDGEPSSVWRDPLFLPWFCSPRACRLVPARIGIGVWSVWNTLQD